MCSLVRVIALLIFLVPATWGQWSSFPTPDVPRTADGKPDLEGPTPRNPDGKPDLSGIWEGPRFVSRRAGSSP
jgi:hypothetical protein